MSDTGSSTLVVGISAKVIGFESLQAKLLKLGSDAAAQKIRDANSKNADEFMALISSIIPRGDKDSHLADTLHRESYGPTGVAVVIGGAGHDYPLHLEAGHRNKGGQHVPGKPFWFPALRVQRKRWRARVRRAGNEMVKGVVASGIATSSGD
jgi:hypothetical protein